jgi:hypothetical protein
MDLTRGDLTMFIYNYAVAISGGWLVLFVPGIDDRLPFLGAALVPTIIWTLYFKYRIRSKLDAMAGGTLDNQEESA